jgi:hypothetical protein
MGIEVDHKRLRFLLGIVYTPGGHAIFGTGPISWLAWLFIVPFMLAMLEVEESRKRVVRRNGC